MSIPDKETATHADAGKSPPADSDEDSTVAVVGQTAPHAELPRFAPPAGPGEVGRLGKYRIQKELGRGGMGVVFLALDERLERRVALKVMLPKAALDAASRNRFLREARAAARINSDHVVAIYEADEIDGVPFIALQHLQGCPLDEYLKRKGDPSLSQCCRIARETALGLAAAHALALVHRDVKPGNVWLEAPEGRVKILDFGLAKPVLGAADAELTARGTMLGTPAYMAPEQGMGHTVDGRADLFSLGCMMYRLVTGKLPFDRPTLMAVLAAVATAEPTPVRELNPAVPDRVADLIRRLMAKRPADRPPTAMAVAEELAHLLPLANSRGEPPASAGRGTAVSLVGVRQEGESNDATVTHSPGSAERLPLRIGWPRGVKAAFAFSLFGLAVLAVFIGIEFIKKDASVTEDVVPQVTKSEGIVTKQPAVLTEPNTGASVQVEWTPPKAISVGESPFDKLDPAAIPKDERFDWQPKELVCVVGTHAGRMWNSVAAVAVSEDGTKAATVSFNGHGDVWNEVVIWNTATQKTLRRFQTQGAVGRMEFAAGGTRLYLFGDPAVQLWNVTADPPTRVSSVRAPHAIAPYGGWLLEGGDTFCAHSDGGGWDVSLFPANGKSSADIQRREVNVKAPSRGAGIVVCTRTNQVYYPDPESRLRRATVKDGKFESDVELPIKLLGDNSPCGISPDGKDLAVADEKGMAFWDVSVAPPVERSHLQMAAFDAKTCAVVFSPCGRWLVTRQSGLGAKLWKRERPRPLLIAELDPLDRNVGEAAFSPDGNLLVIGDESGFVRFWDVSGKRPTELSPFDPGTAFRHQSYHQTLIRLARTTSELILPRYDTEPDGIRNRWQHCAFDGLGPRPDERPMRFASGAVTNGVTWARFDPAGVGRWVLVEHDEKIGRASTLKLGSLDWPQQITLFCDTAHGRTTPDGRTFITLAGDGKASVEAWDITDTPVRRWSVEHPVSSAALAESPFDRVLACSDDGSRFATVTRSDAGGAMVAAIFLVTGNKPELRMSMPLSDSNTATYIAAMSPDGRFYTHSHRDRIDAPEVLDVTGKGPKRIGNLPSVVGTIHWLAYSPDGKRIAAAGDKGVAVIDAATLQPVWKWDRAPGPVWWLDWAADGRHLVTHNGNKSVYVLRLTGTF